MSKLVLVDDATAEELAKKAAAPFRDVVVGIAAAKENPEHFVNVEHGEVASIVKWDT